VRSVVAIAHEALDKLHAQAQEKQPLSPRRAVNEQAVLRVLHEVPPAEPPCISYEQLPVAFSGEHTGRLSWGSMMGCHVPEWRMEVAGM
jgi:hypothetical protein